MSPVGSRRESTFSFLLFCVYYARAACISRTVLDLARVLRLFFRHAPLGGKLLEPHVCIRKTIKQRTAAARTRPRHQLLFCWRNFCSMLRDTCLILIFLNHNRQQTRNERQKHVVQNFQDTLEAADLLKINLNSDGKIKKKK